MQIDYLASSSQLTFWNSTGPLWIFIGICSLALLWLMTFGMLRHEKAEAQRQQLRKAHHEALARAKSESNIDAPCDKQETA